MTLAKLAVIARKIHRLFVLIVTILGLFMMITGVIMKYPGFFMTLFPSADLSFSVTIHTNISTYFVLALLVMMITGLYLYLYPWIQKRISSRKPSGPAPN